MVKIWDPLVRIFHWGLVASFAIAWFTAESFDALHHWAGYAAAALIAFRLVWGLIGPRYAKFSQFVKGPATVMTFMLAMLAGKEKRYLGHNPAGAAMILALLATIAATAFTGWMLTLAQYAKAGWVESVHETAANLTLILVLIHLVAVLYVGWKHKENLARAMVTGKKRGAENDDVV
ncbi:MAG: cytochrome b/b6 domain-containing protein [Rhizobiales bacterium]|nr:cytochrome b/b6 domain-containing protein [Hyphomicrobiales bacterium]NRB15369.1 cytochrome b/b6 domain-containing protein [Hyphomicrobiales bacterium]